MKLDAARILNFIDGEFASSHAGATLERFEPATGMKVGTLPDSDSIDVDQAIAAAERAFPSWSALPSRERARYLRKISQIIESRLEEFARAESDDTGKPYSLAREVDIPRSAYNFEFFADAATQFSSEAHITDVTSVNYTLRTPLGVVGCISPWNLPLYLLSWKIAPALAAGCTVVAKPSEVTPLTAYLLSEVAIEAGLPRGVLNLVHGLGPKVGAALSESLRVKAISFTGSTATGARIAETAGPRFKKLSLEMGGKNANLIFADADFERAVETTVRSSFSNQGQICLCGSRIWVEKKIYPQFRDALIARVKKLKQGDPRETETQQGAVVSQVHYEKVLAHLKTAQAEGGSFLTGGKAYSASGRCSNGYFIEPTLIEGLRSDCKTNQEEIFGPVATLAPFETEDEVITWANSTRYGLAATIWTRDLERAHRLSRRLETGIVWINCWMVRDLRTPFGGVKDSGVGREGGLEAMRFFTEPKNVCIHMGAEK